MIRDYRFIVLFPHMNTLMRLSDYSDVLFAKGFNGAHSFPSGAPLAELSQPFNRDELKELAGNLRLLTMAHDGKISSVKYCVNAEFGALSFFGPLLDLPADPPAIEELFPKTARDKIIRVLFPPALCTALVNPEESPPPEEGPDLSFRTADISNMTIRPLPDAKGEAQAYSFEWKANPPVWLPAYRKSQRRKIAMENCIRTSGDFLFLDIKAVPGASKSSFDVVREGRLKVRIAAAPEDGKANEELRSFLAKTLGLPKKELVLEAGEKSRLKTLRLPISAKEKLESLFLNRAHDN